MYILGDNAQAHHIAQSDFVSEAAKDFHTKPNVPHLMIDIYRAFEFLIITVE